MTNHKMNIMDAIPGNFTMSYRQKLSLCKGYPAGSNGMPLRKEDDPDSDLLNGIDALIAKNKTFINADGSINMDKLTAHANFELARGNPHYVEAYQEYQKRKK